MKKVCGIGFNDADYKITSTVDGKRVKYPIYRLWENMLYRVTKRYKSVSISKEWLLFSNFKKWVLSQKWEGKVLDKDLFGDGSIYSPETCVFLPHQVNEFIAEKTNKNSYMDGVHFDKSRNKFKTEPRNILTGVRTARRFDTELDAHIFWKKVKKSVALDL